jgi:aminoglycoside phosphotransferase (APT) family kinase protein
VVLMDAAPGPDAEPWPFLAVTDWLRGAGFSAPEVLAADPEAGLILLEDLGDTLYARVLAGSPADEPALYAAAVDLLAALHVLPPPAGGARWRPGDLRRRDLPARGPPRRRLVSAGRDRRAGAARMRSRLRRADRRGSPVRSPRRPRSPSCATTTPRT